MTDTVTTILERHPALKAHDIITAKQIRARYGFNEKKVRELAYEGKLLAIVDPERNHGAGEIIGFMRDYTIPFLDQLKAEEDAAAAASKEKAEDKADTISIRVAAKMLCTRSASVRALADMGAIELVHGPQSNGKRKMYVTRSSVENYITQRNSLSKLFVWATEHGFNGGLE